MDTSVSVENSGNDAANSACPREIAPFRFPKGVSGNPNGRPKRDLDLADKARKHAEKAVTTLAKCLDDPDASWPAKVSAAAELLDRGFGKSAQTLDVDHKIGFTDQFEAFVRQLTTRRSEKVIEHVEDVPQDGDAATG